MVNDITSLKGLKKRELTSVILENGVWLKTVKAKDKKNCIYTFYSS